MPMGRSRLAPETRGYERPSRRRIAPGDRARYELVEYSVDRVPHPARDADLLLALDQVDRPGVRGRSDAAVVFRQEGDDEAGRTGRDENHGADEQPAPRARRTREDARHACMITDAVHGR